MKKILLSLILGITVMVGSIDLNTASKEELMAIKGVGAKKADIIINFRKKNKIKTADDLAPIKGFGATIISNIKNEIKDKK